MSKFRIKKLVWALLGVIIMVLFGMLKVQNDGDRSFNKVVLHAGKEAECTVDLGKMGFLKYWLEPNVFSVAFNCRLGHDTDRLSCRVEGVEAIVSQGSKKGIWTRLKQDDILQRRRKNTVPVNLEIRVPYERIHQRHVQDGKLEIFNNGVLYSAVNLRIINSKYQ
ncbi:MAG: hypothetical protein ACI3ZR_08105 [bacterium]